MLNSAFMGVNDNVWCSVENVHVTVSTDPTEGFEMGGVNAFS